VAAEWPSLDQLHAKERQPVLLADLVDGHDVGVFQAGGVFRLGAEALHRVFGCQLAREDHLERHDAVKALLPRLVDHAHAAAGDLLQQVVASKRPRDYRRLAVEGLSHVRVGRNGGGGRGVGFDGGDGTVSGLVL
jgi:hypothetical protein